MVLIDLLELGLSINIIDFPVISVCRKRISRFFHYSILLGLLFGSITKPPNRLRVILAKMLFHYQFDPTQQEILSGCNSTLPAKAEAGIQLFNEGDFWGAHEALEEAWIEESKPVRALYKAILQAGVFYLQIERVNLRGAYKMHKRCLVWLTPWPDHCCTIDVGQLKIDLQNVLDRASELGADHLDDFDRALFKPIKRIPSG